MSRGLADGSLRTLTSEAGDQHRRRTRTFDKVFNRVQHTHAVTGQAAYYKYNVESARLGGQGDLPLS